MSDRRTLWAIAKYISGSSYIFLSMLGDKVESWFQNGKNSIRIRQKNHQEFIFTFNNEGNWRFETVESFMNGLKGGKK